MNSTNKLRSTPPIKIYIQEHNTLSPIMEYIHIIIYYTNNRLEART